MQKTDVFQRAESVAGGVLLVGLLAVLLFGPLAFGAVEAWSLFAYQCVAVLLLLLWCVQQLLARRLQIAVSPLYLPMAWFALVVGLQLLLGWSAYGHATQAQFQRLLLYGMIFFLALQVLRRGVNLQRCAWTFSLFGFGLAVFALVQHFTSNGKIYWQVELRRGGWLFGPYVNHNHYAGLMEMLAPFALTLGLSRYLPEAQRVLLLFCGAVMGVSVFISGSRAGSLALVLELVLLAAVLAYHEQRRRKPIILSVVLLLALAGMYWWGGQPALERLSRFDDAPLGEHGLRLNVLRDGIRMFGDHPLWGVGLGAFPTVYPRYQSFFTHRFVNAAHNDYLQVLLETGLVGSLAVPWFMVLLYRCGWGHVRRAGWSPRSDAVLAAMCGCTGILVHSLFDFNLQIPANAALFFVLSAVVTSSENAPGSAADSSPRER